MVLKINIRNGLKLYITFTLTLFYIISNTAVAQNKSKKIDELMNRYYSNEQFIGNILVAEKGQIIYEKAFGYADREWEIPNTLDTKFRIGSVTKPFTALLIMQCVEDGSINLNGHICDYLIEFPPAIGDSITISQLLSHTSGLIDYPDVPGGFDEVERIYHTQDRMLSYLSESELLFKPGTQFRYSNFGYYVLGVILEKIIGLSYNELIWRRICEPAGMYDTQLDLNIPIIKNRARGYNIDLFKGVQNAPILDMSVAYSAGGLLSTINDLYRFDQILYTDKLLSDSIKTHLFSPVFNDYALGWEKKNLQLGNSEQTVEILQHPGSINGFQANIRRFIKDKHTIITLNNIKENPYVGMILASGTQIAGNIAAILYNQNYALPKKSATYEICKSLNHSGADSAISLYHRLQKSQIQNYYFSEMELNRLGLKLFFLQKNFPDAIKILNLNISEYPESYNVYDSIGYVYMNHGSEEAALRAFKKGMVIYEKYPEKNKKYKEDHDRAQKHITHLEKLLYTQ